MKTRWQGLLMAVCIGGIAAWVSAMIPGPGSICWAILIGIAAGNLLPFGERVAPGLSFAEKRLLPIAIALMGTELELHTLGRLGVSSLLIVIPAMSLSIGCSLLIGRFLKMPPRAALLLGIGNSVCGSSAILAAAPAMKAEKNDAAIAVAAVNLMGTIGMFILPSLAVLLSLSDTRTSYLIGGSLQAIGQVVAAGFSVSDDIGNTAVVIKMLRVLMIGPIVMILHGIFHSKDAGRKKRSYVPGYIIGFMLCAVAAWIFQGDERVLPQVKMLAKIMMLISMAAVGSRIHFRTLLEQGPSAILLAGLLSLIQCGAILVLARLFA